MKFVERQTIIYKMQYAHCALNSLTLYGFNAYRTQLSLMFFIFCFCKIQHIEFKTLIVLFLNNLLLYAILKNFIFLYRLVKHESLRCRYACYVFLVRDCDCSLLYPIKTQELYSFQQNNMVHIQFCCFHSIDCCFLILQSIFFPLKKCLFSRYFFWYLLIMFLKGFYIYSS